MRRFLACLSVVVAALAAAGCDTDDRDDAGPDTGKDDVSYTRYYMPAASMEPTIAEDSHVQARDVTDYEPYDGDVVVFDDPGGWLGRDSTGGMLIKRVIATPGQVLMCCDEQGRLVIDGKALDEEYLYPRSENVTCNGPLFSQCEWTAGPVPEGTVFVMGDNRANSADSSLHLCLPDETDCTDDPYVPVDLVRGIID